jgi:phage-related tail fiber protein
MDRHWDANGAASAPATPSNSLGANVYPQGGVAPSLPGPWWYHMVTEELRNVVEAAGLTPDRAAVNQLQAALNVLLPAGTVIHVAKSSAPTGFLKANGAAVSRTTYAALFAAVGTTFGAGDGSTTFVLPDLRGEFIRGLDDGRGVDSGRTLGSAQVGSLITGDFDLISTVNVTGIATTTAGGAANVGLDTAGVATDYPNGVGTNSTSSSTFTPAALPGLFGVTRPRNVALLACIKY